MKNNKGFTLLEIILVVAAISILAGIVIFAINPAKQLGDTRNAQRRVDVNTIMNAAHQFGIDNGGDYPAGITTNAQVVGTDSTGCNSSCGAVTTDSSCVDISDDLVPEYVAGIPFDPSTGDEGNTDYYIYEDNGGRLVVGACDPERDETIEITR